VLGAINGIVFLIWAKEAIGRIKTTAPSSGD
jgi:hypothetical protein